MTVETIDEVIAQLSRHIERYRSEGSRLGYFPTLYRRVTVAVKRGIEQGRFDDGDRMERLDVIFANLYFEAIEQWQRGEEPSAAWQVAFRAAERWPPIVLQHLLLGVNAHINLDLGIATARTPRDRGLPALRHDFRTINTILAEVTIRVKDELASIWPLLRIYDTLTGSLEDGFIHFSLARARHQAWHLAEQLTQRDDAEQTSLIEARDRRVARLGRVIWKPSLHTRLILLSVRLGERGPVRANIERLRR